MPAAAQVRFQPGRVYRSGELRRWAANTTRLARRVVGEGRLQRLSHGLYYAPRTGRFGVVPPDARELMRAFLRGDDFVFTGSDAWNALGLGATAVSPVHLVYNRKRSGDFEFAGQRFRLRRVAFPVAATSEWYVVDLLENLELASVDAADVERGLMAALSQQRFDPAALRSAADRYGTQRTRDLVERAADAAVAAA